MRGLLLLTSIALTAAEMDPAAIIFAAKEHVRNIQESYLDMLQMKVTAMERESQPLTCEEQSYLYYNNTAITPGGFFEVLDSGVLSDPSFDLEGFFDTINFDSECEAMGGEVYKLDISIECEGLSTILEDFKHCKPPEPICNEFEYVLSKLLSYIFVPNCYVQVISDAVPSIGCFIGIDEMYSNTAITYASPENFLLGGGAQYAEVSTRTW